MEHDRILPGDKVLESVGLDFATSDKLSKINDSGRTFLHIAAWLEKNRERLELCDGSDLGGY